MGEWSSQLVHGNVKLATPGSSKKEGKGKSTSIQKMLLCNMCLDGINQETDSAAMLFTKAVWANTEG